MEILGTIILMILSGLIGYYFAKKTEKYKFELFKKEQAVKVAELLSLWIKYDKESVDKMRPEERKNYFEKLNRLTWEIAIWIPSEHLVKRIMDKLSHKNEEDIKVLILEARNIIQNRKSDSLKWEDVVHFKTKIENNN